MEQKRTNSADLLLIKIESEKIWIHTKTQNLFFLILRIGSIHVEEKSFREPYPANKKKKKYTNYLNWRRLYHIINK